MCDNFSTTRPVTLVEGYPYLLLISGANGSEEFYSPVEFVSYAACPAMVIVRDTAGRKYRCPREDLLELPEL
jgi:hypothetical protein